MTESKEGETTERFLLLMRHAKSDWSDGSLADHERPLNRRGREAAPAMANWLTEIGMVPNVILSSSSTRTQETAELLTKEWSSQPKTTFKDSLYLAPPETLLRAVRNGSGESQKVMVLAHNPSMAQLSSVLAKQHIEMPTAAVAIFELKDLEWKWIDSDTPMKLLHSMRPKAL